LGVFEYFVTLIQLLDEGGVGIAVLLPEVVNFEEEEQAELLQFFFFLL
jgi:hypothetical protein